MVNPKILIVEDENIVAIDLQKRLMNLGYDIVGIVSTGEDAVRKAVATSPDLVLMDVRLKGEMDGIEAASMLRFQHGVAVVYLSAYADNDTLKRASKTEPFGYILKPFEERELHTTIEMALYRRDMERRFKENETWYDNTSKHRRISHFYRYIWHDKIYEYCRGKPYRLENEGSARREFAESFPNRRKVINT